MVHKDWRRYARINREETQRWREERERQMTQEEMEEQDREAQSGITTRYIRIASQIPDRSVLEEKHKKIETLQQLQGKILDRNHRARLEKKRLKLEAMEDTKRRMTTNEAEAMQVRRLERRMKHSKGELQYRSSTMDDLERMQARDKEKEKMRLFGSLQSIEQASENARRKSRAKPWQQSALHKASVTASVVSKMSTSEFFSVTEASYEEEAAQRLEARRKQQEQQQAGGEGDDSRDEGDEEEEWDGTPMLLGLPGWRCSVYNQLIEKLVEAAPGKKPRRVPRASLQPRGSVSSPAPKSPGASSVLSSPVVGLATHTQFGAAQSPESRGVRSPHEAKSPLFPAIPVRREMRNLSSPMPPGDMGDWRDQDDGGEPGGVDSDVKTLMRGSA